MKTIKLRGQVPVYTLSGERAAIGKAGHDFEWEHVGTFTDADGDTYAELRSNPLGVIYLLSTLDIDAYMVGR